MSPDVLVGSDKADVGISANEGVVADAAVGQPVVSIAAIIQHNTSALVTLASSGLTRPRDLDAKVYVCICCPYQSKLLRRTIKTKRAQRTRLKATCISHSLSTHQSHNTPHP